MIKIPIDRYRQRDLLESRTMLPVVHGDFSWAADVEALEAEVLLLRDVLVAARDVIAERGGMNNEVVLDRRIDYMADEVWAYDSATKKADT